MTGLEGHTLDNINSNFVHVTVLYTTMEPSLMIILLILLSWLVTTSLKGMEIMTSPSEALMFWAIIFHRLLVWFPLRKAICSLLDLLRKNIMTINATVVEIFSRLMKSKALAMNMKTSLLMHSVVPYFLIKFCSADLLLIFYTFPTLNVSVRYLTHANLVIPPPPIMRVPYSGMVHKSRGGRLSKTAFSWWTISCPFPPPLSSKSPSRGYHIKASAITKEYHIWIIYVDCGCGD